jgi:hypothetical protein
MRRWHWNARDKIPRLASVSTVLSVAWLVAVGLCYLGPALVRGTALGPYDLLSQFGVGAIPGVTPHNWLSGDQVQQSAPWATLAWQQVHSGILPLWNPFSGLGLPLAFNFQSAPFGLPALVTYLVPVGYAYTVQVVVRLVIAGTGALILCRALRLGAVAATFAATVFELSGAFTGWLGWPMGGVLCWLGWVMAAALLLLRGVHPRRSAALLAVSLAFAVYGGHPESVVILLLTVGLVAAILLVARALQTRSLRSVLWPLARVAVAAAAGLALAAPLLLPGLQLAAESTRFASFGYQGLPAVASVNLAFVGFYGFPTAGSAYFGPINWYETVGYVGLIVLVLAGLAVIYRWREAEVWAPGITAAVIMAIIYVGPVARLVGSLPIVDLVNWGRALVALDMLLAVLGGFGLQTLLDRGLSPAVWKRLGVMAALAAAALVIVGLKQLEDDLPSTESAARAGSFIWPAVQAGVVIAVVAALAMHGRLHRRQDSDSSSTGRRVTLACATALVVTEVAFLLTAAPGVQSSSPEAFAVTPAEAALQHLVGQSRLGFAACPSLTVFPSLGILPNANAAYGVSELSVYDATIPESYFSAWSAASGTPQLPAGSDPLGVFCPSVSSASLAREFGVSYILAPPGSAAPSGTVLTATLDGEGVYRVPGAGLVTLVPGRVSSGEQPGTNVPAVGGNPASLRLHFAATQASTLEIHITDVPGWTATMGGRPLALHSLDGAMLEASVPPGVHTIVLSYWPPRFSLGLVCAGVAVLGLALMGLLHLLAGRRLSAPRPEG